MEKMKYEIEEAGRFGRNNGIKTVTPQIIRTEPRVYEVKSESDSNKKYMVSINLNHSTCTCKSYIFRAHDSSGKATGFKCKHIKSIIEQLKKGEN